MIVDESDDGLKASDIDNALRDVTKGLLFEIACVRVFVTATPCAHFFKDGKRVLSLYRMAF